MSILKEMQRQIKKLEARVTELESKPRSSGKMDEVANWILSKFDSKRHEITVRRLFELGKKEKGYRYQTLQLARRHMLDDRIGIEHRPGKGWMWVKMDDE